MFQFGRRNSPTMQLMVATAAGDVSRAALCRVRPPVPDTALHPAECLYPRWTWTERCVGKHCGHLLGLGEHLSWGNIPDMSQISWSRLGEAAQSGLQCHGCSVSALEVHAQSRWGNCAATDILAQ